MNSRELLADYAKANADHVTRVRSALAGKPEDQLNHSKNGEWSPYQVIEHLNLSNAPYLAKIKSALEGAPKSDAEQGIRHTWLGKVIIKGGGPSGNAPAPKPLVPAPGPYTSQVFERWKQQQEEMLTLAATAAERDLSSIRIPNPFLKIFKMNLADCFAIFKEHTERHVRQIEERVRA